MESADTEIRKLRRLLAEAHERLAEEVRRRSEAEELIGAIRDQKVDALVVGPPGREHVYVLESAERPYRLMVENLAEGTVALSADGLILYCNSRFSEMLGVPQERLLASCFQHHVLEEDESRLQALFADGRQRGSKGEAQLRTADGTPLPVLLTVKPFPSPDMGQVVMVVTDLSETKRNQELREAQAALQERKSEIERLNMRLRRAMRETHHRVKNNLQVIASLVDMQVMKDQPNVATAELERLGRHIRGLATVHDLLTQEVRAGGDAEHVSSEQVLGKLRPLMESMIGERELEFQADDFRLPVRHGTSLAVLVNELVSNAIRHGEGKISLSLAMAGDRACLEVCDHGPGFPQGFDPQSAASTGIELILSTAQWDLQGSVAFANRREGGACVLVSFPVFDEGKRTLKDSPD